MTQPAAGSPAAALAGPWYRTITAEQWRVLAAAKVGWMLDAMDFMLYAMALGQLRAYFMFDDATAGFLGTALVRRAGSAGPAAHTSQPSTWRTSTGSEMGG